MLGTHSWKPIHLPVTRPNFTISSKFQRSRRRPHPQTNNLEEEEDDEEFGSVGRIIVASIKSTPSRRIDPVQIQPNPNSRSRSKAKKEESSETGAALSGSDVLWALQRVAKEKIKITSKKKKKKKMERRIEGKGRDGESVDYVDVKELNVKSDWEVRLNDLETRLQQLVQSF